MNRACRAAGDIRTIVARTSNAAAVKERADTESSRQRQGRAHGEGLVFNQADPAPFRDKLRAAASCRVERQIWRPGRCCSTKAVGKLSYA